jgi:hypothetical protein
MDAPKDPFGGPNSPWFAARGEEAARGPRWRRARDAYVQARGEHAARCGAEDEVYAVAPLWGVHRKAAASYERRAVRMRERGRYGAGPLCQSVSCGPLHCAAVTIHGEVFTWGVCALMWPRIAAAHRLCVVERGFASARASAHFACG